MSVSSTKYYSPISLLDDKNSMNIPPTQEIEMPTLNFWGQGIYRDDLDFFQSDFYAFLKIVE